MEEEGGEGGGRGGVWRVAVRWREGISDGTGDTEEEREGCEQVKEWEGWREIKLVKEETNEE